MDLTAGVINMTPMSQAVRDAREKVMNGKELSVALAPSGQFSAGRDRHAPVGRGDRADPREPEPPGRRLRGAGLDHGQEPRAT